MKGKKVEAGRRVVFTWVDQFEDGKLLETEARFDLTRQGKGTLLVLTHRGFKRGSKWIALCGAIQSGWAHYLTDLRSILEHGTDLVSPHDVR